MHRPGFHASIGRLLGQAMFQARLYNSDGGIVQGIVWALLLVASDTPSALPFRESDFSRL